MKRTTLALEEDLLRQLKQRAAALGTTVQALANDLLRQALAAGQRKERFRLRLPAPWSAKAQPGVDIADRDTLFELMEGR